MWISTVNPAFMSSSENVDVAFVLFVTAAESSWGESVSETSAPAGRCSRGSVPHAPHR